MTHADDDGMIMPPKIAPQQVVILPVLKGEADVNVFKACADLCTALKAKDIRVKVDDRDMRTPDKMWDAIKKGIPLRVEIGAREAEAGQVTHVRRDIGRDSKATCSTNEFVAGAQKILDEIQSGMLAKARGFMESHITDVKSVTEAHEFFKTEQTGFAKMDAKFLSDPAFEAIRKEFSVTPRCLPFADEGRKVVVGKSY
jgi:prolyl-tRNA synthetase